MVKKIALALLLIPLSVNSIRAETSRSGWQLRLRIGVFTNNTEQPESPIPGIKTFVNKTNLYAEVLAAYYFTDITAFVLTLGSYSKGDIRFDTDRYGSFFGTATIFPLQLGIRLTPFREHLPIKMQPYIEGGGALIVGRETVTVTDYYSYYFEDNIATETNWNWWLGGGVEIPLSGRISIDLMTKYIKTDFADNIAGISDYSGIQMSVGISYYYQKKVDKGE